MKFRSASKGKLVEAILHRLYYSVNKVFRNYAFDKPAFGVKWQASPGRENAMRKTIAICLFLVLCCVSGVGQTQPQWAVVYSVALFNQTTPILPTNAFTAADNGVYRFSGVMSASNVQSFNQHLRLQWKSLAGYYSDVELGPGTSQTTYIFMPAAGTPVTYLVGGGGGVYNIAFTIEQLQNAN
jgi:hypothetical protein